MFNVYFILSENNSLLLKLGVCEPDFWGQTYFNLEQNKHHNGFVGNQF